jgi:hypothetical protein
MGKKWEQRMTEWLSDRAAVFFFFFLTARPHNTITSDASAVSLPTNPVTLMCGNRIMGHE